MIVQRRWRVGCFQPPQPQQLHSVEDCTSDADRHTRNVMEVARAALKPLLQGCVQVAREPRLSLSVYYELHDLVALKNGGPVERWVWVMGECAAAQQVCKTSLVTS